MTDPGNLPTKALTRDVAAPPAQRRSLVTRGLVAIQNGAYLASTKHKDALYHRARTAYNLITDDGGTTWVGKRTGREWLPISALDDAFDVFQRLASEGYGKAYYPLSTLYGGGQSVKGDESLQQRFSKLAFEWCFANRLQADPDVWNDLGHMYLHDDNEQALHWFSKAAERGHAWACFNLSGMYGCGCGVEQDHIAALNWQIKAGEYGNLAAILGLIRHYESEDSDFADDEQALYWYRKAAEQGFPWTNADFGGDRFFELGMCYRWSDGEKALDFLMDAARLNHAEALYEMAELLGEEGEGNDSEFCLKCSADLGFGPALLAYAGLVPEDEARTLIDAAHAWYKEQAEGGSSVWQFEYALLLLRDDNEWCGDPKEGLRWLQTSAEQGYRLACHRLGHEFLRAEVSDHTTEQAVHWYSRAAQMGDFLACEALGDFYLLGHGEGMYAPSKGRNLNPRIKPDKEIAVRWYERGIEMETPRGVFRTAFKLGELYLKGEYIDRDLRLAEKWLLHSAKGGYASAQESLGSEYASGARLPADADAAVHWLKSAAATNSSAKVKLAEIYLDGSIVPRDLDEGISWLVRVGAHWRNGAMKVIAKYLDGRLDADDEGYVRALLWRLALETRASAADAEDIHAASNAYGLAELYELGLGFAQDTRAAIHWYKLSAKRGHYGAKTRLNEMGIDWESS